MEGINRFEEFLRSIGCPTRLSELGIGEITEKILSRCAEETLKVLQDEEGRLPGRLPLRKEDIVEILSMAT
nr:hypothetical protein [Caldicoprobacter algeriensis]